jgi:excisionase family DNA binding protein
MTTIEQLPDLLAAMQAEIERLNARVDALERQLPDLLSSAEAAEMLAMHEKTVKLWIYSGKLPAEKYGGRKWKIRRSDVVALIEARNRE